jgi:hypothetical protein
MMMAWPPWFRPTRMQGITWALTIVLPMAAVAGLVAAGTLHPLVHDVWGYAGLVLLSVIGLGTPGALAIWQDTLRWNAIPSCRRCGRKMIPEQVRVSWWTRLRYYRCDCARREAP